MPRKYRNKQHKQRKAAMQRREASRRKDGMGWARAWASQLTAEARNVL